MKPQSPFFTRFLTVQKMTVRTDLKAGRTLKYPSDRDETITD